MKVQTRSAFVLLFAATAALTLLPIMSAGETDSRLTAPQATADVDFQTWIDANSILMFVTNKGSIAYDNGAYFGKSDGLYYPFSGISDIVSGFNDLSVIYAGSIWIGGVDSASGDTLITSGQHDTDWGVGPIVGDSSAPGAETNPAYRVYKLYRDSLADNPNQDYLEWPTGDGAPLDGEGNPLSLGDQTLWSVYNDLNVNAHVGARGTAGRGLGVEVHQTVWASPGTSVDTTYDCTHLRTSHLGGTNATIYVQIVDTAALNQHTYQVVVEDSGDGPVWHLIDMTILDTVLAGQTTTYNNNPVVTEGFRVQINVPGGGFESFEVVANAAGAIDPPESGAAPWAFFPVPTEVDQVGYPTENQQVGDAEWLFHTADNGGSCGDGDRYYFDDFLSRSTRDGANMPAIAQFDYEMRFTGSNANPGVNGSYAIEWYNDDNVFWVPFELWNIGKGTPDDPGDDFRLVPFIMDDGDDNTFNLESWGCIDSASHGGDGEHVVSGGDNDPFTDWVYWLSPVDQTPGESGYLAEETAMLAGGYDASGLEDEILARTVLVNWNGGVEPPFNQDIPEEGTVFRIRTAKNIPADSFSFAADVPIITVSGNEGSSVYARFKMINKGDKTLKDFYACIWFDPDLGDANDDLVGCDTLDDVFFCYNAYPEDTEYGTRPPAVGAKILEGPIVPSPGDVAHVDGVPVPNYKNLGMGSFAMFVNPYGPDTPTQSYYFMRGLQKDGSPIPNGSLYFCPGDPVTGTGDLDVNPADRRMMANVGPFTFRPGDTQQVVIRLSAARASDRLASVSELRSVLNQPYLYPTDVDDPPGPDGLPADYALEQNYPNPFNPATTIEYSLPTRSEVTISIYNILGQEVKTLVNTTKPAGNYVARWDGTDRTGERVASGVYFYRIKADDYVSSKKMLLLK